MSLLTEEQVSVWRTREAERQKDAADIEFNRERDERRRAVRAEMLAFLDDFLNERINLQVFKDTFHKETSGRWAPFGLGGLSGAMFSNTLYKYVPDQAAVTAELRRALRLPPSVEAGREQMKNFHDYLTDRIQRGEITRRQVQPARIPFYVSSWWHLQQLRHALEVSFEVGSLCLRNA